MALFALMTAQMDDVNIDFAKELILFEDELIPFSDLMVRQNETNDPNNDSNDDVGISLNDYEF